jgi:hypothetical protein
MNTRRLFIMAALCLAILTTSCAGTAPAPNTTQAATAVQRACSFYRAVKPEVGVLRTWAAANRNATTTNAKGEAVPLVPASLQKSLDEAKPYVDALDRLADSGCTATDEGINWSRALSLLIELGATYAQLHAAGTL